MNLVMYGGSFNPPHYGHLFSLCYAASLRNIDKILVIPCFTHPYGKELEGYKHRVKMCKIAFEWLPKVEVSELDKELGEELGRQVYAYDTVCRLCKEYKLEKVIMLVGGDVAKDLKNWHCGKELMKVMEPMILDRHDKNAIIPNISSTEVRDDIGWAKDRGKCVARAPAEVLNYIYKNGLYGT